MPEATEATDSGNDGGSIRAILESAMADDVSSEASDAIPDGAPAESAEPAAAPAVEAEERPRDEHGRFVAKDGEPAAETPVAASPEDAGKDAQEPKAAEPAEAQPIEPPADWSLEDQQLFRSQPPATQQWMLDKAKSFQSDYTTKMEEVSQNRAQFEDVFKVLEPRMRSIQMEGLSPGQAVQQLFALSDFAAEDPGRFIQWYAGQRGVDLSGLVNGGAPQEQLDVDPTVAALQQENATLKQQLGATATQQQQFEQRYQADQSAAQRARDEADVAEFRNATNEDGAPKHPYFDEVRSDMGRMISAELAPDLETAYDRAVRMNPTTYAKLQAADNAATERKRDQDRREKAAAAQRAGASITGASSAPAGETKLSPGASVREHLEAQFAAAGGLGRIR